jgi:hypothetical protein
VPDAAAHNGCVESASVESQDLTLGVRRRVIVVQVVAVVLGLAIALFGLGASLATLYLRGWSAQDRDSSPEDGYKFLLAVVVGGTVLLEIGVRFATKRVVRRLRSAQV